VRAAFNPMALTVENVRSAKLRALAVTSAQPSAALPGVPVIAELVPGYEASGSYSICAPKKTPDDVVRTLHDAANAALADPKLNGRLTDLGIVAAPMTNREFETLVADEIEKWGKVIRTAGIKLE
jgi:tripartite-type tricarboxylate transporter receptor subunit TctC